MEDKLLVFRCKRGSAKALARIYEKYRRDLLLLAIALLHDTSVAEDVVHDVFVSFVRTIEGFRLTGSLKSYLLTCVANDARNKNKARRRQQNSRPNRQEYAGPSSDEPTKSIMCNEQLQQLSRSMGRLPYEQREVVIMHLHGAMTFRTIAKTQGISENTVKSRYRYALDKLRVILNGEVEK